MSRGFLFVLTLVAATACKKKDTTPAATPEADAAGAEAVVPEPEPELLLRETVLARPELQGIAVGVVGEIARGERRAIVVWPALREGKILDDDIVAYVYKRDGEGWTLEKENMLVSQSSGESRLAEALGGADAQEIVRACGLAPRDMAGHLQGQTAAFQKALAAGDTRGAIAAYEQLARAFAWNHVALSDMVPELLTLDRPMTWYCGDKGCTLEITVGDRRRAQTFAYEPCRKGVVLGAPMAPVD